MEFGTTEVFDRSLLLGWRIGYNLYEADIPYEVLCETASNAGVDQYTCRAPNAADVFRRTTNRIKGFHEDVGKRFKVDVIPIENTGDELSRIVMVVDIDHESRDVSDGYKVARLEFSRIEGNGRFEVLTFDNCPDFVTRRIERAVEEFYMVTDIVSFGQFRGMLRNIMLHSGSMLGGRHPSTQEAESEILPRFVYSAGNRKKLSTFLLPSVWNIPLTREHMKDAFVAFANGINARFSEPVVVYDVLPILRTDDTERKFRSDAVFSAQQRLRNLVEEEKVNIARSGNPDRTMIKARERVTLEMDALMELVGEQESLLNDALDEIRDARQLAEQDFTGFCLSPQQIAQKREVLSGRRKGRAIADFGAELDANESAEAEPAVPRLSGAGSRRNRNFGQSDTGAMSAAGSGGGPVLF